jgi:hypothetical protein
MFRQRQSIREEEERFRYREAEGRNCVLPSRSTVTALSCRPPLAAGDSLIAPHHVLKS